MPAHRRPKLPRRWRTRVTIALCAGVITTGGATVISRHENASDINTASAEGNQANHANEGDRAERAARDATRSAAPTPPPVSEVPAVPSPRTSPSPAPAPPRTTDALVVPAGCTSYTGNRRIGCALLPTFGFGLDHMPPLDELWRHESNWNHLAENPSSGAYGIPQALPGSKMATVGADWATNPVTQIKWGLGYIRSRYGTPAAAWSFWQGNNWY